MVINPNDTVNADTVRTRALSSANGGSPGGNGTSTGGNGTSGGNGGNGGGSGRGNGTSGGGSGSTGSSDAISISVNAGLTALAVVGGFILAL